MIYKKQIGEPTKGSVILVHGLGEHSKRYEKLIQMLSKKGYAVYTFDWPGHGKSSGKKGHTRIEEGLKIIDTIVEEINTKPYLFGHSMGGLAVIRYSEIFPDKIKGMVLSSPELAFDVRISPALIKLAKLFSLILPNITINNRIIPEEISRNEESVKKYVKDPLVHDRITLSLNRSISNNMKKAYQDVDKITCSVLILGGTDDMVVPFNSSKDFFKKLKTKDKNLIDFKGAFHEVFEDSEWGESFHNKIVNWINTH